MKQDPDPLLQNTNQISQELLAATGLNPWVVNDSSSRLQMFSSHISQCLVVKGAEIRRNLTLSEREFGTATFRIEMPANAEILAIIPKYRMKHGRDAVEFNPLDLLIFEDLDTREVSCLEVPNYHCIHQHFGFTYVKKPLYAKLHAGATVPKGSVLADSPTIDEHDNYMYGLEVNTAFMSVPGVIEDGVVISESLAKRMSTKGYESRFATWGEHWFPLNLYGTIDDYRPFPEIGQPIRDDGLVFALRKYDPLLAPVEMTPAALMQPDYTFDRLVYGKPNGRVTDISIRNSAKNGASTPVGMDQQTERYFRMELAFHEEIIATYNELKRKRHGQLRLSPQFHSQIFQSMMYRPSREKGRATHIFQRTPMDDWRVEVFFDYDIVPTDGFKLTGGHGNKGVVCQVWPDEDMPIDANGIRAEAIMDGDSVTKRMNIGVMYEHYTNATSAMISEKVRIAMQNPTAEVVEEMWKYVLRYYEIVSPRMHAAITGPSYQRDHRHHLETIAQHGIYLYMPTDNPQRQLDAARLLRAEYPLNITPVTYRGRSGNVVQTVDPVLIGSMYLILLEKTGEDYSAVASGRLQHFGIPAKLTKADRHAQYARAQPVRVTGETEVRLLASYIGGKPTAHLLEMSNNPVMHKHVVSNILRAEQPTNILSVVDWDAFPVRGSRSQTYINHSLQCAGAEFHYSPYKEIPPVIYKEEE